MTESTGADAPTAGDTLSRMLIQGQQAQALIVAAQLGIADLLAEGPRRAEELATTTGTHPGSLYRLLRALAGLGVFSILEDGRFALTQLAEPLRTGVPGSLRALAQYFAVEAQAWSELLYSVQTGASAWEHALGIGHYAYFAQNPEANAHFNAVMAGNTARALPDILAAYDFKRGWTRLSTSLAGVGRFWRASCRLIRTCKGYCSTFRMLSQRHSRFCTQPELRIAARL
jgi:methyltransferase family protein